MLLMVEEGIRDGICHSIHRYAKANNKYMKNYNNNEESRGSSERKNEELLLKCFSCDSYYEKKFNKELIKKFKNTYSFCNNDLNKFILLLTKGVYPYEYMDSWEKFNKTSLPIKEDFYSHLNREDIEEFDYRHGNNVFNNFKLNNLGDYHDLYVQSDSLLLADVFKNLIQLTFYHYQD